MNKRLKELQTEAEGRQKAIPDGSWSAVARGRVEGYRECWEQVATVLEAIEKSQAETHAYYCCPSTPCPLCIEVRDALAKLERENDGR